MSFTLKRFRYKSGADNKNNDYLARHGVPASYADRSYSLPRTMLQHPNPMAAGYYTTDRRNRSSHPVNGREGREAREPREHHHGRQNSSSDRSGADTPDFYFMPSQRKYSGEVVRVYVDYKTDPKN